MRHERCTQAEPEMPVEITCRIRRDELLSILETEAPVTNQRTTAPMPAVTLTDLLCIREEDLPPEDDAVAAPPPPVRRMRANTVPAPSRSPVRAVGTDPQLKALPPRGTAADVPAVSRTSTYDTPALIVDRAPVFDLPAAEDAGVVSSRAPTEDTAPVPRISLEQAARELAQLITRDVAPVVSRTVTPKTLRIEVPTGALTPLVPAAPASRAARTRASTLPGVRLTPPPLPTGGGRRTMRAPRTFDVAPLEAIEIANVVDRIQEAEPSPEPVAPVAFLAISFASPPAPVPALTTEQLSTVSLRPLRPLVIAASCLVTLVLALLMISLL